MSLIWGISIICHDFLWFSQEPLLKPRWWNFCLGISIDWIDCPCSLGIGLPFQQLGLKHLDQLDWNSGIVWGHDGLIVLNYLISQHLTAAWDYPAICWHLPILSLYPFSSCQASCGMHLGADRWISVSIFKGMISARIPDPDMKPLKAIRTFQGVVKYSTHMQAQQLTASTRSRYEKLVGKKVQIQTSEQHLPTEQRCWQRQQNGWTSVKLKPCGQCKCNPMFEGWRHKSLRMSKA